MSNDSSAGRDPAPEARQDWQPIESFNGLEIQFGTGVIVCEDGIVGEAVWRGEDEGWWWINNNPSDAWGSRIYPTHWMPLPAPPAAKEDQ